jgi:hypothetical protein
MAAFMTSYSPRSAAACKILERKKKIYIYMNRSYTQQMKMKKQTHKNISTS